MSEIIKHECGIAMIRLLKPQEFYLDKYGSSLYGINKMQILIQKMRNRGQDGAGIATVKLDPTPGTRFISRYRTAAKDYIQDLFEHVYAHFDNCTSEQMKDVKWLKANKPYTGEVLLGHLRYGTYGLKTYETCHPFLRQNNWISRNLVLAGNFNLTNVDELFEELISLGQYPKEKSDTVTVLEKIGHFLDNEVQRLFEWYKRDGTSNQEITNLIIDNLNVHRVLKRACRSFDGGYVMGGMIGHGDSFMIRDEYGIRPCYYYADNEIVVAASERPAIQTAFGVKFEDVKELPPAHALVVSKKGVWSIERFKKECEKVSCSFERIYFSRGTDSNIYKERKLLGYNLTKQVLSAVNYDLKDTVFSYVPNTAETAFLGLIEGVEHELNQSILRKINTDKGYSMDLDRIHALLTERPRVEKIVVKDAKMRTFIADTESRKEMVSYVYDVTYGIVVRKKDTLVILDDSIVRGTTMRDSILTMLDRLRPKKILVVSSAPQIRYPDFYGIDMSQLGNFVAFQAAIALLKENDMKAVISEVYENCQEALRRDVKHPENFVKKIYAPFSYEQVSKKIAQLLTPKGIRAEVEIIYQTLEGLHGATPRHKGDWYFSGDYPTIGGQKLINKAFVYYIEGNDDRPY